LPRVIDNIDLHLSAVLRNTMRSAQRADFCVGYFNLRGWKNVSDLVEGWSGQNGACCRLLVGMQRAPQDELRAALSLNPNGEEIDNGRALDLRKRVAADFRQQLTLGTPSDEDERGLRCLSEQLKYRKLVVKLFLRHTLHAKLYMVYQDNFAMPIVPYVGSSNLTYAGLRSQGELNVDVADNDAAEKLQRWFEDRWNDRFCIDISAELAQIIDESWARPEIISPYHIYLAMAYHLSQEARIGVNTFRLPREFEEILFDFQTKAVQIAAHHLNKRGGVVVGDVVGLGKTLIGTALARVFQDDIGTETLIICPKNLAKMWQEHVDQYRLVAKVVPLTMVESELPDLRRYRMVLIDESHNLRNREGKRYRVIRDYINANDSRCILLSATPYNKTYEDLSNQLRLFIPDGRDLGVRPERKLKDVGETEFIRRHQCSLRSLEAFDKSEYADDWRELMRLYLVRRTRSFIQANYAETDPDTGRKFLRMADGTPSFFPSRVPKTVAFEIRDADPGDPYARLYSSTVVDAINALSLPRYGLGSYVEPGGNQVTEREQKIIADLSRGGKRLMGFCRTNLFKRLESGGPAFLQSIERHILRNFIMLHAIEAGQEIPIGTQDAEFLEVETSDRDPDPVTLHPTGDELAETPGDELTQLGSLRTEQDYRRRAAEVYDEYAAGGKRRFRWLRSTLFTHALRDELEADARSLLRVREFCGHWDPARDTKLGALAQLLQQKHRSDKVLVFTQYADTVEYLTRQLQERGVNALAGVTGDTEDPTEMARRFSPHSNQRPAESPHELRVMIATDVLSEGQNLQDCHIVVNYDLPWAIIRLIQRAGRVDRIGQTAERILAYIPSYRPRGWSASSACAHVSSNACVRMTRSLGGTKVSSRAT
jgi:Helicase conserved C-terminal domain/PLD-like domain